ncbi:MAG: ribonuclease D [Actinomycetota bacterium]|nr:ribonuclease D [Actinomycetota bacterium]
MTSERAPIANASELEAVVAAATVFRSISIDTEFLREKTYRAKLCLVQIAIDEEIHLIDPLGGLDLKQIAELIADPDIEIVIHAGKQDFELFFEDYGVVPANVFDVQLAAAFAGYGSSLPYGRLVSELAGVQLVKGESYTDWCRRPLTEAQARYAADDVRYLGAISARVTKELEDLGRVEWAREEMRRQFEDADSYRFDPESAWLKVSGRGSLSARQLTVLKEVARWREETASSRNVPRGWLVRDPSLVEIARRGPSSAGELKSIRGFNAREVERSARDIIAAVEAGSAAKAVAPAPTFPKSAQARARMLAGLADAIVRARCERAKIATELVTNRTEVESLLAEVVNGSLNESRHRLLDGWRRDLAGEAVLDLARGRIALRAVDRSPYIQEVPVEELPPH